MRFYNRSGGGFSNRLRSPALTIFAFLSLALLLIVPVWSPTLTQACTLPPDRTPIPPPTPNTVAYRVANSKIVLEGTVTQSTGSNATVTVSRYFKGNGAAVINITGFMGGAALCRPEVSVNVGTNYIFYLSGNDGDNYYPNYSGNNSDIPLAPATPEIITQILAATGQPATVPMPNSAPNSGTGQTTQSPTNSEIFSILMLIALLLILFGASLVWWKLRLKRR